MMEMDEILGSSFYGALELLLNTQIHMSTNTAHLLLFFKLISLLLRFM